ncbi:MAG: flagella basal body P-ring formation protein FlgA [Terracidiphilus sp.]
MKAMRAMVLGATVTAAGILPVAFAQSADGNSGPRESLKSRAANQTLPGTSMVREIEDPNSGVCWLLLVNPLHPGEPGRLVRTDTACGRNSQSKASGPGARVAVPPVIHTGEKVILEEHSPVVDGRLDAIALNPAAAGERVRVRLLVGGRVVRALAAGPGRVALEDEEQEGRP